MVSLVIVLQNTTGNQLRFEALFESLNTMQKLEKKLICFYGKPGGLKTVAGSGNEPGQWQFAREFWTSCRGDDISKAQNPPCFWRVEIIDNTFWLNLPD